MTTRPTAPNGALDAARDAEAGIELLPTEPLATVTVQQAPQEDGSTAAPPTVTVEVTLPPLPPPTALDEELAIRIDDVPVDATTLDFASVRTSSIELPPGLAAMDVSALLSRTTGPQLRVPPGLRTTGPTPRITTPVQSAPRPTGSAADTLLGAGSGLFGGHVPGATGEVPRVESASAPAPRGANRGGLRDLRQATRDAARSIAARVTDGRSARRDV